MEEKNIKFFYCNNNTYAFFCDNLEIVKCTEINDKNTLIKFANRHRNPTYTIKDCTFSIDKIKTVSINLVNGCNLNCSYCFISAYQRLHQLLSFEQFEKIVSFFASSERDSINFYFSGGGEPLLNFKLMQQIPSICSSKHLKTDYIELNTNGTLITNKTAVFFKQNNWAVNVSVDGDETSHDQNRKYKNGSGSFKDALRGVDYLQKNSVNFACKTVITPNNTNTIKTFNFFKEKAFPFMFDISTPSVTGHYKPLINDLNNFDMVFSSITDSYISDIQNNNKIYNLKIMIDLKKIHYKSVRYFGCGACKNSLHTDINGKFYTCAYMSHNETYSIGDIYQGIAFEKATRNDWFAKYVGHYDRCKNCWLRHLCGGACFALKWLVHNNTYFPYEYLCKYYDIYWSIIIRLYISTYNQITDEANINTIINCHTPLSPCRCTEEFPAK